MLSLSLLTTFLLSVSSGAHAAPSKNIPTLTRRDAPPPPGSTACGDIVKDANVNSFPAALVYECLTSVPFNAAVSTKFLKYYKDSVQFQSTLEYLKDPPAGYRQPATDLVGNLEQIQALIDTNQFRNQYEFEAALQSAVYATHDDHLSLAAGILGVFSFGSEYRIVSLSKDGIELPKVYLAADIVLGKKDKSFTPSPIVKLDGKDAVEYLTAFAAKNAVGGRESHTDWNSLMSNPAQVIQGIPSLWGGGATFYPGETLTIELLNKTVIKSKWYGVFHGDSQTGPLKTGGDFYNSFVLGFLPASFDEAEDGEASEDEASTVVPRAETSSTAKPSPTSTRTRRPAQTKWPNIAYPKPDLAEENLGSAGGGILSAYFLEESSTAVLSVPSFQASNDHIYDFSEFVGDFIKASKKKGLKKVVIDLQRNFGGDALLATDMFKQFFPTKEKIPFGGSRMRGHKAANIMGKTLTDYWKTTTAGDNTTEAAQDYYYLYSNEWVASTRINAETNKTFKSWEEFYGPHQAKGGNFTTTQQYPLADALFDTMAIGSDEGFIVYGYGTRPADSKQEYAAENIIMLTDGHCSSTCSLFVEMMHQEAGVRTVVAGGRPEYGPMQALGLSRGAASYDINEQLDSDIADTITILEFNKQTDDIFPGRAEGLDVEIYKAGVNIRDQVRKGEEVPLQFVYDAADCRIFFTRDTVFNFTNLWKHAAAAIWTRPELCVKDSTGFATTDGSSTKLPPNNIVPTASNLEVPDFRIPALLNSVNNPISAIQAEKVDKGKKPTKPAKPVVEIAGKDCSDDTGDSKTCGPNYFCDWDYAYCDNQKPSQKQVRPGCVKLCKHYYAGSVCTAKDGGGNCEQRPEYALEYDTTQAEAARGFCDTPVKSKKLKCDAKQQAKAVKPGAPPKPGRRV